MSYARIFHRRTPTYDFPVYDALDGKRLGHLGDLSQGGLQIYGPRRFPADALYEILIEAPGDDGAPRHFPLKAKVMWSGPDYNPELFRTGLRLLELDRPPYAAALAALLDLHTVAPGEDELNATDDD